MNPVLKRVLTGLTIAAAVVAAVVYAPAWLFKPAVAALICLAMAEFLALLHRKMPLRTASPFAFGLAAAAGCALIAGGLWSLVRWAALGNLWLLYVVAIVKLSDVGGFAVGLASAKHLKGGSHKLCPRISPGKSWEGLFGSILFSSVASCAFAGLTHFSVPKALLFGLAAALVGTAGDLVESKFKRWVGVKDSSALKLTNGMGGVLDMLDSLLFAPAAMLAMV